MRAFRLKEEKVFEAHCTQVVLGTQSIWPDWPRFFEESMHDDIFVPIHLRSPSALSQPKSQESTVNIVGLRPRIPGSSSSFDSIPTGSPSGTNTWEFIYRNGWRNLSEKGWGCIEREPKMSVIKVRFTRASIIIDISRPRYDFFSPAACPICPFSLAFFQTRHARPKSGISV